MTSTDKKTLKYVGYGILTIVAAVVGYKLFSSPTNSNSNDEINTPIVDETIPIAPTIDKNKKLSKGSTGLEVKELQKLMGNLTADGIFGSQTETRLLKLKGVKSISINQFKSTPTINTNTLSIGSKIMANKGGVGGQTIAYKAEKLADNSFQADYKNTFAFDYGELIGEIKGKNGAGTYYLVLVDSLFDYMVFVKATDVKKI
jgi:hypothetical protein